MMNRLRAMRTPAIKDVRGRGLWAGVEIDPRFASARTACEQLLANPLVEDYEIEVDGA